MCILLRVVSSPWTFAQITFQLRFFKLPPIALSGYFGEHNQSSTCDSLCYRSPDATSRFSSLHRFTVTAYRYKVLLTRTYLLSRRNSWSILGSCLTKCGRSIVLLRGTFFQDYDDLLQWRLVPSVLAAAAFRYWWLT
jgi:hypothetical protein